MSVPITVAVNIQAGESDGSPVRPLDLLQAGQYDVRIDAEYQYAADVSPVDETISLGTPIDGTLYLLVEYVAQAGVVADIEVKLNGATTGVGLQPGGFLLVAAGNVDTLVVTHTDAVRLRIVSYG